MVIGIVLLYYDNCSTWVAYNNISDVATTSTSTIQRNINAIRMLGSVVRYNSTRCQVKKFQYSIDVRRYHHHHRRHHHHR